MIELTDIHEAIIPAYVSKKSQIYSIWIWQVLIYSGERLIKQKPKCKSVER